MHGIALIGLCFIYKAKMATILFNMIYAIWGNLGVAGGAHRLWSHRSYKANFPLRIFLMLAQTSALQNDIYVWSRDHRLHHKHTDTNADPHNANRGFFFSHIGWLMVKKHPDVLEKGKTIYMDDIQADPVVTFQRRFYVPLTLLFNQLIPILIPCYFFGERLGYAFVASVTRYTIHLNMTWTINSVTHFWGMKPFDKNIRAVQNRIVNYYGMGEGYHNYHHTFPWDYKNSEFGNDILNCTTAFIDWMARRGWATDLKTTSAEMIRNRALRTGDGSWSNEAYTSRQINLEKPTGENSASTEFVWGWGDADMRKEDKKLVRRGNKPVIVSD